MGIADSNAFYWKAHARKISSSKWVEIGFIEKDM